MLLGVALLIVVPLKSLRVCCSAVLTVSGLLCVDYFLRRVSVTWVMATDSAATTGGRAGIAFDVELVVPWDAPEAAVDLHSNGVVELDTVPDVLGLTGRRPGAAVVRVLQGRDVRSVRALVPDPHSRYGGLTRTVGVYGRVASSPPTVAGNGAPKHGVATAGLRYDACTGQETLP